MEKKKKNFWEDFKDRLGTLEFLGFQLDPAQFIQPNIQLQSLDLPFLHEEIDAIVRSLPNNKSPRPDGFNNEFLKKSWPTIKCDFMTSVMTSTTTRSILEASTLLTKL
jgi:hypothetical protein